MNLVKLLIKNGITINDLRTITLEINGGKGSGNWGHSGRPGKVGGSGEGSGGAHSAVETERRYAKVKSDTLKRSIELRQEGEDLGRTGLGVDPLEKKKDGLTKSSIVGVAGDDIPERVPRLKGLTAEQKKIESDFAQNWEDPKKREEAIKKINAMPPFNSGTVETDAIKQLDPKWGSDARMKELKNKVYGEFDKKGNMVKAPNATPNEKAEFEAQREYRQRNNTLLHQTANVLAKEVMRRKVAEASKGGDLTVIVTSGGCASGKGFGLEDIRDHVGKSDGVYRKNTDPKLYNKIEKSVTSKNTLIWDAAGDQNGTELDWVSRLGQKKTVILHTEGDPAKNAQGTSSGLVGRAHTKGRMVDAQVYAQSYNQGNQNIQAFYKNNKNNPNIEVYKLINDNQRGEEPPKVMEFTQKHRWDNTNITRQQVIQIVKDNLKKSGFSQAEINHIDEGATFFENLVDKELEQRRG